MLRCFAELILRTATVEMVRVEVAFPLPGVMLLGENEQLNVLGRPPHESAICPLSAPDSIAAMTITFPDLPMGSVTFVGDAVNATVVGGAGVGGAGGGGGVLETVFGQLGL